MRMQTDLLSVDTLVQAPFVKVKIGEYEIGTVGKSKSNKSIKMTYPNYISKLAIKKINGQVNTYTLSLIYAITQFDDPNKFEKIFSTIYIKQ